MNGQENPLHLGDMGAFDHTKIVWTSGMRIEDNAAGERFRTTGWWIPSPIWNDMIEEAELEGAQRLQSEVRRTAGSSEDVQPLVPQPLMTQPLSLVARDVRD